MYELFARVMLLFQETPANHGDDCQRYAAKVAGGYRPMKPNAFPPEVWSVVEQCWAQDQSERPSITAVTEKLLSIKKAWELHGSVEGGKKGGRAAGEGVTQGCGCVIC
jgi:hypothetical protein